MIYIKDMDMPVDCMECKIDCKHENYLVTGRPFDCPLEEAKTGDLISRADAIEAVKHSTAYMHDDLYEAISIIPSAETTGALDDAIAKYVADGYMLPPSGDYISRADAIEAVQDHFNADGFKGYDDGQKMMDRIKALPSAEAERNLAKPNKELKGSDFISRVDAMEAVKGTMNRLVDDEPKGDSDTFAEYCAKLAKLTSINVEILKSLSALPSAEVVRREDYNETDGVIAIEKQSAKDVGEIKHIIIRSPNYTRYFYNESMQLTPAEAVQGCDGCIYNTRIPQNQCLRCERYWRDNYERKGGDTE